MKESATTAASAGTKKSIGRAVATPKVAETIEAVFGCKWSLRILGLIRAGVYRPAAIERALEGLTPKVQNYYFRRMVSLGILERVVFAEVPPRVEYRLTDFGQRFMPVLDAIGTLQNELEQEAGAMPPRE